MPNTSPIPNKHLRLAYILTHSVLFIPVLLWPLPTIIFHNPMLHGILIPTWLTCIVIQLLVAAGMDSMLYKISNAKQAIDATLWIALLAMFSISTLQKQESAWMFGIFFLVHSCRAAAQLMQSEKNTTSWWLWLAWSRDIMTAVVIFVWSLILTDLS
ncbi:MAG: hypothetical protein Q9N02_05425 [Ghiorsea sp.]|nr:hypothetical protein [Ghiorsea sp.]